MEKLGRSACNHAFGLLPAARLYALAALLCLLQVACKPTLVNVNGSGETRSSAANVTVTRQGQSMPQRETLGLEAADVIETNSDGVALIRFPEGDEMLLRPNTKIQLGTNFLFFGELLIRARGFFKIETNFMTAGVEGTEFAVRSNAESPAAKVVVLEGAVVCSSKAGAWAPVRVTQAEQLNVLVMRGKPQANKASVSPEEIEKIRQWTRQAAALSRIGTAPIGRAIQPVLIKSRQLP